MILLQPLFLFLLLLLVFFQLIQKLLLLVFLQQPLLILFGPSLHYALLCFHSFFTTFLHLSGLNLNLLELLCDFPQHRVHTDIGPLMEGLLAHGTLIQRAGFPVSQDTALAEVVPTGDGDGVGEDVQTDGAVHLLFRKVPGGGHSYTAERQGHFQHKQAAFERGIKPAVILRSPELDCMMV